MQVVGEERELDQPPTSRVTDRDLLWVESVSERLLGSSAPRAWEKAFFRPEESDPVAASIERPGYTGFEPEAPRPRSFPPPSPSPSVPPVSAPQVPSYFAEGDADWRHDLGPEFPDDPDEQSATDEEPGVAAPTQVPDQVIDLTEPVRPQPPAAPVRIDDEILRLALGSGDSVLANTVILLLEARSRDRQRIATLEIALRALVEQVDRVDGPDHELATTARLLRRVVEY